MKELDLGLDIAKAYIKGYPEIWRNLTDAIQGYVEQRLSVVSEADAELPRTKTAMLMSAITNNVIETLCEDAETVKASLIPHSKPGMDPRLIAFAILSKLEERSDALSIEAMRQVAQKSGIAASPEDTLAVRSAVSGFSAYLAACGQAIKNQTEAALPNPNDMKEIGTSLLSDLMYVIDKNFLSMVRPAMGVSVQQRKYVQ